MRFGLVAGVGMAIGGLWSAARGADQWPDWRGPELNRTSAARDLPLRWSTSENVKWRTELPAWAAATPVVWGERIFLLTPEAAAEGDGGERVGRALRGMGRQDPGGDQLLLVCIDRGDGAVRWRRPVDAGNVLFGKQNMASPSPVTDGERVFVLTGTGMLAAFDFEGNQLWRRALSDSGVEPEPGWGYASSPLLHEGRIIVQALQRSSADSALLAFDAATGAVQWRVERETDAEAECPDAYTTPTLSTVNGRVDLVVSGADYVTGHDPANGAERWRAAGLNPEGKRNYRVCPSPVAFGERLFCGSRKKPVLALRGGGAGEVTASHTLWRYEGPAGPDVPTPVCDGERLYLVEDRGIVTCLSADDGSVVWGPERTALGTVSASPLLADGRLYVTNENAVTTVLRAGGSFEVLAENELDGSYTIASPVAVGRQLLIRTGAALYCIEGS